MQIIFYQNKEEKNRINKTLTPIVTLTGNLTAETSLIDPTIKVSQEANTPIVGCNYCYIPAFGRYYYITDMSVVDKMLIINLHCDVLMSFKSDIMSSKCVINRANTGNNYITDNLVLQTPKVKRQCQKIGSSFTKSEKFVIQIGG